jgi:hypothetical protein
VDWVAFSNKNSARANLTQALLSASQGSTVAFDESFNMSFTYTSNSTVRVVDFAVHHHIHAAPQDAELAEWMQKQRITPWVAVAAPLQVCSTALIMKAFMLTEADYTSLPRIDVYRSTITASQRATHSYPCVVQHFSGQS